MKLSEVKFTAEYMPNRIKMTVRRGNNSNTITLTDLGDATHEELAKRFVVVANTLLVQLHREETNT